MQAEFDDETRAAWANLYPDPEFLRRQAVKAWEYYRDNPVKKPKSMKGWKRAFRHWLESDWPKHVRGIPAAAACPRERGPKPINYGPAQIPRGPNKADLRPIGDVLGGSPLEALKKAQRANSEIQGAQRSENTSNTK